MIRADLTQRLRQAVDGLVASGALPAGLPALEISDPRDPAHGDFATNFALVASKPAGKNPRELAEMVRAAVMDASVFDAIDVAGPGFINFRLTPSYVAGWLGPLLAAGEGLAAEAAKSNPSPKRINVEFVSVNPNGPITIGSGRGAAFGSTLCNVLAAAGNSVHREYYINDGVNSEQMRQFAMSLQIYVTRRFIQWIESADPESGALLAEIDELNRSMGPGYGGMAPPFFKNKILETGGPRVKLALQELDPERVSLCAKVRYQSCYSDGHFQSYAEREAQYPGDYVDEAARLLLERFGSEAVLNSVGDSGIAWYHEHGQAAMLGMQRRDLTAFATEFDTWFSEQSLHDRGIVAQDIEALAQKGAADTEPIRHKLKLGKGGVLEDVIREQQASVDEDLDAAGDDTPPPDPLPSKTMALRGEGESRTLWLRSTKFGDDQDRVLKRQDGRLTYIASDVAYHKDKFNRPENADKLITVLGPDHHGYIGRLHAVVAALLMEPSNDPNAAPLTELEAKLYASPAERDACQAALALSKERLEVVIFQLVRFMKDGKPAPMRKRDGNIYALIDLVDEIGRTVKPNASKAEQQEVGKDVARFFYLMRSHDTTFDFDLDLAERQSDENPVFYVQYAHARICSVIVKAAEAGLTAGSSPELLAHPKELALIKMIADLPFEVSRAAEDYGVHRLATYAIDLARAYHHFYDACRVIQPEAPELSRARLALCVATRNALRSVFALLGISAPERMDRAEA